MKRFGNKMKAAAVAVCAVLALGAGGMVGCSTGSGSGSAESSPAASSASSSDFLLGDSWKCTGVLDSEGKTHELSDVLNAYVMSMKFYDDECRIYVDTNFTIVKWELNGDDITLSGEGTYHVNVEDDGAKLLWKNFQDTGYDLEFVQGE